MELDALADRHYGRMLRDSRAARVKREVTDQLATGFKNPKRAR